MPKTDPSQQTHVRFVAAVSEELGTLGDTALGVGPVRAAAAAGALLASRPSERWVFVGTAGRYPGGPPIGAVVEAGLCGWAEAGAVLGHGYVPLPPPTLSAAPLGLPLASVLTLASITTDPALARRFAEDGWAVEHLETYAVAHACAAAGVPFSAVLGITNDVGPDAHRQWLDNRDAVQRAVQEVARRVGQFLSASSAGPAIAPEP